ncbi:MAG TPA: hypothetical protein VK477_06315, partial [Acidobacteriota bacterium]|nr:hypothetical protein [Acidobacteriota bacterium]
MSTPTSLPFKLNVVTHASQAEPGEITAARELARLTGATVSTAEGGVRVALASRGLPAMLPSKAKDSSAWMWLRIADHGSGEICATHGSFLFAAVRLLATGTSDLTREKLAAGILLPATFG